MLIAADPRFMMSRSKRKPHVELEWDNCLRMVVAKRAQIGLPLTSSREGVFGVEDVITVPDELFQLQNLDNVLTVGVWQNVLSESDRKYLSSYLPEGVDEGLAVGSLLGRANIMFGNTLSSWGTLVCSGNMHPDVVMKHQLENKRGLKAHCSALKRYHGNMVNKLQKLKDVWQTCKNPEKEFLSRVKRAVEIGNVSKSLDAPPEEIGADVQSRQTSKRRKLNLDTDGPETKGNWFDRFVEVMPGPVNESGLNEIIHTVKVNKQRWRDLLHTQKLAEDLHIKSLKDLLENPGTGGSEVGQSRIQGSDKQLSEYWQRLVHRDLPVFHAEFASRTQEQSRLVKVLATCCAYRKADLLDAQVAGHHAEEEGDGETMANTDSDQSQDGEVYTNMVVNRAADEIWHEDMEARERTTDGDEIQDESSEGIVKTNESDKMTDMECLEDKVETSEDDQIQAREGFEHMTIPGNPDKIQEENFKDTAASREGYFMHEEERTFMHRAVVTEGDGIQFEDGFECAVATGEADEIPEEEGSDDTVVIRTADQVQEEEEGSDDMAGTREVDQILEEDGSEGTVGTSESEEIQEEESFQDTVETTESDQCHEEEGLEEAITNRGGADQIQQGSFEDNVGTSDVTANPQLSTTDLVSIIEQSRNFQSHVGINQVISHVGDSEIEEECILNVELVFHREPDSVQTEMHMGETVAPVMQTWTGKHLLGNPILKRTPELLVDINGEGTEDAELSTEEEEDDRVSWREEDGEKESSDKQDADTLSPQDEEADVAAESSPESQHGNAQALPEEAEEEEDVDKDSLSGDDMDVEPMHTEAAGSSVSQLNWGPDHRIPSYSSLSRRQRENGVHQQLFAAKDPKQPALQETAVSPLASRRYESAHRGIFPDEVLLRRVENGYNLEHTLPLRQLTRSVESAQEQLRQSFIDSGRQELQLLPNSRHMEHRNRQNFEPVGHSVQDHEHLYQENRLSNQFEHSDTSYLAFSHRQQQQNFQSRPLHNLQYTHLSMSTSTSLPESLSVDAPTIWPNSSTSGRHTGGNPLSAHQWLMAENNTSGAWGPSEAVHSSSRANHQISPNEMPSVSSRWDLLGRNLLSSDTSARRPELISEQHQLFLDWNGRQDSASLNEHGSGYRGANRYPTSQFDSSRPPGQRSNFQQLSSWPLETGGSSSTPQLWAPWIGDLANQRS